MKGPFVNKNNEDVYESDQLLQWLLWLIVVFYAIMVIFYVGVFINNTQFEHTYTKNPSQPGILTSQRYNIYWTAYMISVIVALVFPIVAMLLVGLRNIYGMNILNTTLLILIFSAHLFSVVVLTSAYIGCNQPFNPNNPCNAKKLCCVEEIYTDLIHGCPNVTPCSTGPMQLSDVLPDPDFVWIYWINIYFFTFHIVFLTLILMYWNRPQPNGENDDDQLPISTKFTKSSSRGGLVKDHKKKAKKRHTNNIKV